MSSGVYKYISNQSDLYDFLQNNVTQSWSVGYINDNFSVDVSTWTRPTTTFGVGKTLDGRGKTITLTGTTINWTGLFLLSGGTVKNFIYEKGTASISYSTNNHALLFGMNASLPTNASTVDGIFLSNFSVPTNKSTNGGFAGQYNRINFMNCQLGTSSSPYVLSTNRCGGFASTNFAGSFTNCIVYFSMLAGQNLNGGFLYEANNAITFTRCRSSGVIQGSGNNGGFVGIASINVTFNNCYSFGGISNDSGASTSGGYVGDVTSGRIISLNNCYYMNSNALSTSAGSFVSSSSATSASPFYLNLYNTASPTANILSTTSKTAQNCVFNNLVPQYFNNSSSLTGFNGAVRDITALGSDIYVGGDFTSVNGDSSIQYLAKWNSTTSQWESVGGGAINGAVYSLAVLSTTLYIGGAFTTPSSKITKWNGTSFASINSDTINNTVYTVYPEREDSVFIGGNFLRKNDTVVMINIAKWNGSSWNQLSGGLNSLVRTIIGGGSDGTVYIGGDFNSSTSGTIKTLNRICYYDGSSFQSVGSATDANAGVNTSVYTLVLSGTTLYIGGAFTTNNLTPTPTTLNRWASQDTTSLTNPISAIGTVNIGNGLVNKIIINNGIFYIGGTFTLAGGFTNQYLATYNPSATETSVWSTTSLKFNNSINSLFINGGTIYAGGNFTNLLNPNNSTAVANVNRFMQIPLTYNKTNYSSTGQPSSTTAPILIFNSYFNS